MYSLIGTAKLNDIDPRAWLADVLARINDHPASRLTELPWNGPQAGGDRTAAPPVGRLKTAENVEPRLRAQDLLSRADFRGTRARRGVVGAQVVLTPRVYQSGEID
jgi:IS66 C-terminal element